MANPVIFWNDGSVVFDHFDPAEYPNVRQSYFPGAVGFITLPQAEKDRVRDILTSGRSVDRTATNFIFTLRTANFAASQGSPMYFAGFGTPQQGAFAVAATQNRIDSTVEVGHSSRIDFQDSFQGAQVARFLPPFFGTVESADDAVFYYKNHPFVTAVEMVASRNGFELYRPPQSDSFPRVSRQWNVFPRTSVRGDFLGADSRPATGKLMIEMEDLTHDWIMQYWEPFREHAGQGGMFVYAQDWENSREDVAYCFAMNDIPPPKIEAGGYGKVSAEIGVAVL